MLSSHMSYTLFYSSFTLSRRVVGAKHVLESALRVPCGRKFRPSRSLFSACGLTSCPAQNCQRISDSGTPATLEWPVGGADLEWKLTYVGSAESEKYDQVLDSVLVGPVAAGQFRFVFQVGH